jgi:hypothetical protein
VTIEVARGFVGQQEGRTHDDRAGDGDALLFTAGELLREMPLPATDVADVL